jgi:2',3'-cyclic-nucleotide 2'-phosphodiesterase (5'-nucleotidase family)
VDSTRIKYGDAVVVDAGDWAPDAQKPVEEPKFEFLLEMANMMGYDALGVGERELAFGVDRFKAMAAKSKAPILSSNLIDKKSGKPAFKTSTIVKKGGLKVGIFAVLGPKIELPGNAGEQLTIDDPIATAQKMVADLRKQVDVVVCLAHIGRVEGEDLAAQVPGIDVLVLAHHPGFVAQGRRVGSTVTVASGEQGQNIGLTLLTMEGKKVADLTSETRILMPEVGERADIAKLVKAFDDKVNEEQRKLQQSQVLQSAAPQPGQDQYLGSENCMSCHKSEYEHWQTTQHAHAFATLERTQKDSTPECVQCHVVGFGRPGGYQNATKTAKLKNVGCESCHGFGTQHDMFAKTSGKVAEAVCVTCHTPANDPGWNYAAKLPRVSH